MVAFQRARRALAVPALLAALLAAPNAVLAQVPATPAQAPPPGPEAPVAAAPRAPGEQFFRISVLELSQYSYVEHPFLQITGDSDFKDGDATTALTNVQTPVTAQDENIVLKVLHSLPAFGVETGTTLDFVIPRAISIGFDYTRFSQTDKQALDTTKSVVTIPRIQMDTYLYSFFAKAYAFPVNEPGMNFFAGLGLGYLEGKFDAIPFAGASQKQVAFSQSPVGLTQLGVEALGENWGVRYEVRVVRARKVKLDENPYLNQSEVTTIDFSGTIIKMALFYQF